MGEGMTASYAYSTAALIEEARALSNKRKGALDPYQVQAELEDMVDRLAAALEEATPPEGWRVSQYKHKDGGEVVELSAGEWWAYHAAGSFKGEHPTARAAMEALDGAAIDTSAGHVENS